MVAILLVSAISAQEPVGVREFFPFGVYAGGNGPVPTMAAEGKSQEEQIEFSCRNLAARWMRPPCARWNWSPGAGRST